MKEIVFATNNAHKLQEVRDIARDDIKILSLNDIDCHDEIPETATTLEGNAKIKADYVKELFGYDCFADDTGFEIDALNGQPGVYSARYAGDQCNSEDNIDKVLRELKNEQKRDAQFRTIVALRIGDETTLFEGKIEGQVLEDRQGKGGFGYDSIFRPNETECSFAEMPSEEKNKISHRGQAIKKLFDYLESNYK